MIDTHCHLNFKIFNKDFNDVVRRFKEKGGEALIVVGAKENSSIKAVEITHNSEICWATIGIHPHHALSSENTSDSLNNLDKLIGNSKKIVAIGETGLDYFNYKNYPAITPEIKEKQKKLLRSHLTLSVKKHLPLIIHCRDAFDDLITEVSEFNKTNLIKGVLHCFEGNSNHLQKILLLGFYIGFDGNITYQDNNRLRDLVKATPLDRLLLETDSPYLTPEPLRGKRNEPVNMAITAKTIASLKNTTLSNILMITSQNAKSLFKL